jgi:opacity protein-like surface antigen
VRSVRSLVAAGAVSLLSSVAFAGDMTIMPPPQMYAPPPVEDFGGWYLRGDIGFSNQRVKRLNNALDAANTSSSQRLGFDTAGIFGLGVGYRFNPWLRGDVTGEYRGNSNFNGLDLVTFPGGFGAHTYHATTSGWLALANAYVDLGTWWGVTPFVGAGAGAARVSIANFTDLGNTSAGVPPGLGFADNLSKWNFAWALHAGLAYKVSSNFTVELAYRYLDMGDGLTGDPRAFDGTNSIVNPTTFKGLTSHDLKMGVRWNLDGPPPDAPPAMRKG